MEKCGSVFPQIQWECAALWTEEALCSLRCECEALEECVLLHLKPPVITVITKRSVTYQCIWHLTQSLTIAKLFSMTVTSGWRLAWSFWTLCFPSSWVSLRRTTSPRAIECSSSWHASWNEKVYFDQELRDAHLSSVNQLMEHHWLN